MSTTMSIDEEMIEQLLKQTRQRITAGDRDNALAALIQAISLTRGEDKILETLAAAKEREEVRARQEAHMTRQLHQPIDEAVNACRQLVKSPSCLQELGDQDLLRQAFEDGSSVICQRCTGLVPRDRWGAHCDIWCPALESQEDCGEYEE
jgi:hypothetical protein